MAVFPVNCTFEYILYSMYCTRKWLRNILEGKSAWCRRHRITLKTGFLSAPGQKTGGNIVETPQRWWADVKSTGLHRTDRQIAGMLQAQRHPSRDFWTAQILAQYIWSFTPPSTPTLGLTINPIAKYKIHWNPHSTSPSPRGVGGGGVTINRIVNIRWVEY